MQTSYARLMEVAQVVFDEFDVPPNLNGFTMSPERLIELHAKGHQISRIRVVVFGLAYQVAGLTDRDVRRCLDDCTSPFYRSNSILQRCEHFSQRDDGFRRCYTLARYRLIGLLWGQKLSA